MARPKRKDHKLILRARETVRQTKDCSVMRQALAVLLPAETGCTLEQTALLLGVGRATVPRLQARFLTGDAEKTQPRSRWGGRRRALMSGPEGLDFLKPWEEQSRGGGVLVLSPIRAALSQKLGRPVTPSVFYRLLERHGWRKVAPDTRHPKSDPAVQEDWKICPEMNTDRMNEFLLQVGEAHGDDFIVMILDGASSRKSKDLAVPGNMRLHRPPGYSPELNPQEHVWDELREKEFPNRVFESMDGVLAQLNAGLPRLAANTGGLRSLTAWPWIVSLNLNAT